VIAALFRRFALGLIGASMLAAAAAVLVFALAFALYAFVEPYLGRAGAAAVLAGVVFGILGMIGFALMLSGRPARPKKAAAAAATGLESAVLGAFDYLKERPFVAIAIAVGAGFMAIRNPAYLGSVLRSMLEGDERDRR
jgi:hypothetical protein